MAKSKQAQFVAVVEDYTGLRAAILNLLAAEGISARGFRSAEQFLQSRVAAQASCIVLDIQLPGMSGLDLYDRLADTGKASHTILITGRYTAAATLSGRVSKTKGIVLLRKPFSDTEFLRAIRRGLKQRAGAAAKNRKSRSRATRRGLSSKVK